MSWRISTRTVSSPVMNAPMGKASWRVAANTSGATDCEPVRKVSAAPTGKRLATLPRNEVLPR